MKQFNQSVVIMLLMLTEQYAEAVSSGYSNDPVMANFSEYGFCGAMVKPFQIRELMEFVGKALSS